jgi:pyruvate/2-oxoglutarate dehydrogenase complex dihydrolipoamide dehydrogenase (E3) component
MASLLGSGSMPERIHDLIAIGGGTAGLIATLGVAGLGGRAVLIEADRTGGDCLWTGCVPSKALLAAATAAHQLRTADRFGLDPVEPQVDLSRVLGHVRGAIETIEPHDSPDRLRAAGVEVIAGRGRFVGPGRIEVEGRELRYRAALISTGARPVVPPVRGLDAADADVVTSHNVWDLKELPKRLVVLGGGPIGCELGQAFARLGSEVTVIELEATLLPREERDVGRFLETALHEEGVDVRTGRRAVAVAGDADGARPNGSSSARRVRLDDGNEVPFDQLLIAAGRRPNTADLGLETVDVGLDDRGFVAVDDTMATAGERIYAAGDVTGRMPFTHAAANQARLVVTNSLFGLRRKVNDDTVPWVTFTDPEVARVGFDRQRAEAEWGSKAVVIRYQLANLDRAITDGHRRGWVELVGDPKRRLVGATIVGHSAGESIAEMTAWITSGAKIDAISTTVHAYPTFAEGPSRAADDVLRARYFNPRLTAFTGRALALLRTLDRRST